jgi:hypothetical protein
MSKHVTYREYTISSPPLPLLERDEWKPEIVISSEREGNRDIAALCGRDHISNGRGS